MAREKDIEWNVNRDTWSSIQVAVLMDLRDQLKQLNGLLMCPNFTDFPHILRAIRDNTFKKRRATTKRKVVKRRKKKPSKRRT